MQSSLRLLAVIQEVAFDPAAIVELGPVEAVIFSVVDPVYGVNDVAIVLASVFSVVGANRKDLKAKRMRTSQTDSCRKSFAELLSSEKTAVMKALYDMAYDPEQNDEADQ